MSGARPSLTPGDREGGPPTSAQQAKSQKPSKLTGPVLPSVAAAPADVKAAQQIAGSLQWLVSRTRPDLSYTVSRISSLSLNEPKVALMMAHRALRYLVATESIGLYYALFTVKTSALARCEDSAMVLDISAPWGDESVVGPAYAGAAKKSHSTTVPHPLEGSACQDSSLQSRAWQKQGKSNAPATTDRGAAHLVDTWADASFAPQGQASHLGMAVMWGDGLVAWRSGRASFAALSTCEAELQAASLAFCLGVGIVHLLADIRVPTAHTLYCDNEAAIAIMHESMSWRTRHLAVRAAALRDHALADELVIAYASSSEQRADGLTKQLGVPELMALFRTMMRLKEEE